MDALNLKAFCTVAELSSFSLAAEKLHLTQPAISKRVHNLEEELNNRLFDRISRKLFLTEAGRCLLPNAQAILQMIEDSRQQIDDLSGQVKGELRLTTSHHIGLHRLPHVLQRYKRHYPEVNLSIDFQNSQETHQSILAGEADLGITTQENMAKERIDTRTIWHDTLVFVAAAEHPLSSRKNLSLKDLSLYPAILPDAKFTTGRIVRELFIQHGLKLSLDQGLCTDYLETLKALVSIGNTWSVLPETMLSDNTLAVLEPDTISLHRDLVCISHSKRKLNRASQSFIELLESCSA